MSFMAKLKDLVGIDDDYDYEEERELDRQEYEREQAIERRRVTAKEQVQPRNYGLSDDVVTVRRDRTRERERENVIAMPSSNSLKELTTRFKLVVIEPQSFNECPKLVDSLKARKPVIINLEKIETNQAKKIFDFLLGATYALNGNVQKIATNIYVFLPENVDVSTNMEHGGIKFNDDNANPWK